MTTHKHHIIPKHAGGSNDKSNIIELTVEQHSEAHRILYEKYGRWQDKIAWKALSGQITSDEARRQATIKTWSGRKHTDEAIQNIKDGIKKSTYVRKPHTQSTKKRISEALIGHSVSDESRLKMSNSQIGIKPSQIARENMSKAQKGRNITWDLNNNTQEANKKRSESMKGRKKQIIECPHCNKTGGEPQMKQWHFDKCKGKK